MNRAFLLSWLLLLSVFSRAQADSTVSFNEIMYHPATNEPAMEWIELRNQLAVDVDISGWSIQGGVQYTFLSNTIVRGGGYLVVSVAPEALKAALGVTNIWGPFTGRLNNSGEELRLLNNSGRVVDEVNYGVDGDWPVGADGAGFSLAKKNGETASGPAANWTVSEQVGGTPGTVNFILNTASEIQLIAIDQAWRAEQTGVDPAPTWGQLGFNDAVWANRPSLTNRSIPTLFSTGIGTNRVVLGSGQRDPHYELTFSAQGGTVPTNAIVMINHSAWLANNSLSTWIGVTNSGVFNVNAGPYYFRTTFSLDGFFSDTAQINLSVAADDEVDDVLLNGNNVGINYTGFSGLSAPFPLATGFVPGLNTLEFRTLNGGTAPNPGGFRVLATGSALAPNTNSPLAAGRTTYYFRKSFLFSGTPGFAQLRLRTLVADGAVFYLNGVEVHRQNLPAGPIDSSTPALAEVSLPTLSAPVIIPAGSLVSGANVLAVEVHQATGSTDAPLVGVELFYSALPVPEINLAFNEAAPATNQNFFVEIVNYGTNGLALGDYVVVQDGVTNRTLPLGSGSLAPGAFAVLSNEFGSVFAPGDKLFLQPVSRARLLDGLVLKHTLRGRFPAGTGPYLRPSQATPGSSNQFNFHREIVINEIMYHHQLLPSTNNLSPRPSPEAWIELFNRSATPVDLTGWEINGGVSYRFSAGKILAPGGYLVVAEDAAALRADYPAADIVGNLGGKLSGRGERIVLQDPAGNPANEVHFRDSAPWPEYADGGGSSLELCDPFADNQRPEAWAASDESNKTVWQTYSYRTNAVTPPGLGVPDVNQHKEFDFGLLGPGECLIDDITVVDLSPAGPVQMLSNGDFENGLTGWRVLGTHVRSRVEEDPDNPGNHVLHVIASGPQEHMHNHIEKTSISNRVVVASATREYQISYRARWLAGNNFLNTRLYFNRAPHTSVLPIASKNGTPGGPNSRLVSNIGPTFSGLKHSRVVPQPSEAVTVSVSATDPQGVSAVQVFWSPNGGAWASAAMTPLGHDLYTGTIPGFPGGTIVQFYVRAVDGLGAPSTYPAAGPDSGALYTVADGQANLSLGHNLRIVLTPANANLMHAPTNVMSNDRIPGTLIYDENRAYYNVGIRLKGSEHGRYHDNRVSWHMQFPSDDPFRGVHPFMLIDRSGAGDTPDNRQSEILIKHILLRAGNIPSTQSDISRVIAPRALHTGASIFTPRHEDEFLETAYENGANGTMWELELIYVLVGTNQFGYKIPAPDVVFGTDIGNLGDNKEFYRYNFIIKNHRDADDYSQFIALAKTFSVPAGPTLDTEVPQVMDIDEWARTFALETLCGVNDTYTFGNDHNLFMYARPSDGRFVAFSVDMDFAFSRDAGSSLIGDQNLSTIFNRPAFRRLFYAHVQDIIATSFNSSYMSYWVPHYQSFAPGQNYSFVIPYISSRVAGANSQINSALGNVAFSVSTPANLTATNNLITLTGVAPVSVRTIRINGKDYPITWTTVSGWTIRVPVSQATTRLQIEPIDKNGNVISNLVKVVNVNYTGPTPDPTGAISFNEIMYNPPGPDAGYVELINTSNQSFDLSGWRINGLDFTFPAGSVITNRGLIVLASSRPAYVRAYGTNAVAPFAEFAGNLQNDGETLTLLRPGVTPGQEIVVDKVRYESASPWPSLPNGGGGSLQLIDPAQDHSRVGNWSDGSGWRFYSYTGVAGASPPPTNLLMFLNSAGDVYIDQVSLVAGSNATLGVNLLLNGSFEDGVAPWVIGGNHSGSAVVDNIAFDGTHSLHVMATGTGTTVDSFVQALTDPLLTTGTYTFSFWYLPSTNGTGLRFRITSSFGTGNGVINYRPVLISPGTANSGAVTLPPFPLLYLNEVLPENLAGLLDNVGEREPWIELYNAGSTPITLDGFYLANNYSNLAQWPFPAGATLQPGQYKIVFADGEPGESTATAWHTSFRLTPGTGSVALAWTPRGVQILDYLNYTAILAGHSYGDYPDGQLFERQEFYNVTAGAPNNNAAPPLSVRINEWMADNTRTLLNTNNSNRFDDWFELYNPSATPANLQGYFLTDNLGNRSQFEIPAGYVIPPGGYLIVWADGQPNANAPYDPDLHVSFKLNQDGEAIGMFASDGTQIDAVTFEPQFADISQGRVPNGTGPAYFMATPTPRGPNSTWANRYPTLASIPDAVIFRGQTLSFSANASDPDGQTLAYTLDDGAPVGATINPGTGLFNWTAPAIAGTNSLTIRVTDNGVPALSAARSFRVVVATSFRVSGITRQPNGDVVLTIGSIPGKTYHVDYKNDLGAAVWTPITPDRVASSTSLILTDPAVGSAQRFYRVQQLD
ncbi:MAG TPA: lamin tail domain-containing protein [Verrucomicrobiae bacterium]|nr:lamin tail domain-containing protein [Verrucomicrobiae bacterium]